MEGERGPRRDCPHLHAARVRRGAVGRVAGTAAWAAPRSRSRQPRAVSRVDGEPRGHAVPARHERSAKLLLAPWRGQRRRGAGSERAGGKGRGARAREDLAKRPRRRRRDGPPDARTAGLPLGARPVPSALRSPDGDQPGMVPGLRRRRRARRRLVCLRGRHVPGGAASWRSVRRAVERVRVRVRPAQAGDRARTARTRTLESDASPTSGRRAG